MISISDFGGWLLHWVAAAFIFYVSYKTPTSLRTTQYFRAVTFWTASAFFFIGAIWGGFALGGGSFDPTYSVGKFVRPYGKIGGGVSMAFVAWNAFLWQKGRIRSKARP